MKIELSNEQFRTLAEAVALAHVITDDLSEFDDTDIETQLNEERHHKIRALEDYVVQHAPLFDALDIVENDGGILSLNEEAFSKIMEEIVLPYDNSVFWDELEDRLVERELAKLEGEVDDLESVEHQLRKD